MWVWAGAYRGCCGSCWSAPAAVASAEGEAGTVETYHWVSLWGGGGGGGGSSWSLKMGCVMWVEESMMRTVAKEKEYEYVIVDWGLEEEVGFLYFQYFWFGLDSNSWIWFCIGDPISDIPLCHLIRHFSHLFSFLSPWDFGPQEGLSFQYGGRVDLIQTLGGLNTRLG